VVEPTAQYDKQRRPTDEVYYPTLTSALRLVTCGGLRHGQDLTLPAPVQGVRSWHWSTIWR
jgi:hypothetical protein